jgi:filamentous hemagglutinin family protein
LFHSFGDFGVPTSYTANFLNETALPTSNILGRVTGGNPSNIFGTIQTTGFGSANLFLMNPAGIVFGPSASLNVGGSVSFTTADYSRLGDGAKFKAIPGPADASISSAPVAAFGFLGSNPGAITVQGGELSVVPGHNISLVGGNITIESGTLAAGTARPARLETRSGTIALASVASPGEILTGTLEQAPNVDGKSFGELGTIQVSQQSVLDSSGFGGGAIRIRGGSFVVDDSKMSANVTGPAMTPMAYEAGGGIDVHTSQDVLIQNKAILEANVATNASPGAGSGGVRIEADRIGIVGVTDPQTFPFTGIQSFVDDGSQGRNGGDIRLEGNAIFLEHFAFIDSRTNGVGNAGNTSLRATGNIDIKSGSGVVSLSGSDVTGPPVLGNAGNIDLLSEHGNIKIEGVSSGPTFVSSDVTTQTLSTSRGNTGQITVMATEGDVVLDQGNLFTLTAGTGRAGRIDLEARNLLMSTSLIVDNNFGTFRPDGITISLSDQLSLTDRSVIATGSFSPFGAQAADLSVTARDISLTQGALLTSSTFGTGHGGNLIIKADSLQITDGGQVTSGSTQFRRAGIVLSPPTGSAGNMTIQGRGGPMISLTIDGPVSGIFSNAEGTGAGGNLSVTTQSVSVNNGGTISAATSGTTPSATGGSISISATQGVSLNNGGAITASSTGPANAGNIAINAGAQFFSQNGSVTTEANQASGGNITIQATDSIRLVNSQLSTSVQGGPNTSGGHILLDPAVVTMQNSQVRTEAVHGNGGNINIIAGAFLTDQTSLVSTKSERGISGTVNIQSPVSSLSNTLATLPQRPLQAQNLLSQRCAAQINGQMSSLVLAGRDALPVEPGGWLMSPMAFMVDDQLTSQAHAAFESLDRWQEPSPELSDQRDSSLQRGVWNRQTGCKS